MSSPLTIEQLSDLADAIGVPLSSNGDGAALTTRRADLARVRPFRWAWQSRVLLGYMNLLVGDEGVGKGTFIAWLVARLTRGELPGDLLGHPARVLMVGDEDGFDNVTVPRLHVAGADLSLVEELPVGERGPLDVRRDAEKFKNLLAADGFQVVVFDQFLDNLGASTDDWRAKQVREAVGPLRRIAAELDVAMLATLHTNKSRTGSFRQRVAGSQAFNALSRSSLLLGMHPDESERRVLVRGKGNYAKPSGSFEFSIATVTVDFKAFMLDVGKVDDITEGDLTADDLLGAPAGMQTKADRGRALIAETLAGGEWVAARAIIARLAEENIGEREAYRLSEDMGVERRRSEGFPSSVQWRLASAAHSGTSLPDSRSSRTSGSDSPATPASAVDRHDRKGVAGLGDGCACSEPLPRPAADGEIRCARCEGLSTWGASA